MMLINVDVATRMCACGCGQPTLPAKHGNKRLNIKIGEPNVFLDGHQARGAAHPKWHGGRSFDKQGYVQITAGVAQPRYEHVVVVERAMDKQLRPGAPVHHVDGDKANNAPSNLVACHSHAYHKLLHVRQRALQACGNANWRACVRCGEHADPKTMWSHGKSGGVVHPECQRAHARQRYARQMARRRAAVQP